MKIVLVKTKGVNEDLFNKTAEFLKGFSGVEIVSHTSAITLKGNDSGLDFEDFFSKCDAVRDVSHNPRIDEKDFVVLLTEVPNANRYFSFFQKSSYQRNAFVNTENWEFFTGSLQVHYALAYQIVENCLQSLMNLDEEEGHSIPRGCVNDFCYDKTEVILKMQTANICLDCRKTINAHPEALAFQKYALSVMNSVRLELVVGNEIVSKEQQTTPKINPEECRLIIDTSTRHFRLTWNSTEIANFTMPETSYVFYLTFLQEFAFNGLGWAKLSDENIRKFMEQKASQKRTKIGVQSLINESAYFLQRNSLVNRAIEEGFLEKFRGQTAILEKLQITNLGRNRNENSIYSIAFSRENISFLE